MIGFLIQSPLAHFARTTPHHPALACEGRELSYAELDAASNRLANALIERGLCRQDRVGIFMHKGLDLGVAIYAVVKAGGVFVPLDPFMPTDRLAFIINDCEIRHLVSANPLAGKLRELRVEHPPVVYGIDEPLPLDGLSWDVVRRYPATLPDVWLVDQDLAYIMYTSGSTGVPKGMMHTHLGSVSYARWGAIHVGMKPDDRVASHAPLHFDLSIFDFFSTAHAGATVVLVPETVTRFPASWTRYIETERISIVFTVPFTLIEMQQRGGMEKRDLSSLRWILFGGEPYPPKHLRALMRALPDTRFTNVYGPAEAPSCTCHDITAIAEDDDDPIPIGTVSLNSDDLILNEDDEPCGAGEPGELCIRSSTLTRGYWKRPDLNARAYFVRDSFGPFPDVFYRTGDMVVRRDDGLLYFLGRSDRMVKTRGHRVELDEVEAVLASHPAVSEAAVYAVPDATGSKVILASVTLHGEADAAGAEVARHARRQLPPYALPRAIDVVAEMPRTTSGKIDRNALCEKHPASNPTNVREHE